MVKISRRGSPRCRRSTVRHPGPRRLSASCADNPGAHRLDARRCGADLAPLDHRQRLVRTVQHCSSTSLDVGNTVTNVIPATASAMLNIRFNGDNTGALRCRAWVARRDGPARMNCLPDLDELDQRRVVSDRTRRAGGARCCQASSSTSSGVEAEARYRRWYGRTHYASLARYCPVAEFWPAVGATMHHTGWKRVPVARTARSGADLSLFILAAFLSMSGRAHGPAASIMVGVMRLGARCGPTGSASSGRTA